MKTQINNLCSFANGDRAIGDIPAGSKLIFEVELVGID